jgi:hypothetical protein
LEILELNLGVLSLVKLQIKNYEDGYFFIKYVLLSLLTLATQCVGRFCPEIPEIQICGVFHLKIES